MRYGYETAGGERVTALRDMFDGGGAGRSGDEFEGGGILSLIANLLATPYGSQRQRTAGIIDQPTRPPRTRPAPPPTQPADAQAAAEMMMGSDPARDIRRLPSETLMSPDLYEYYRQGGPSGDRALDTPLQAAPLSREANLPTPRPVGASFEELAEMALAQAVDNRSRLRVEQLAAVLRDPDTPAPMKQQAARELSVMAGGAATMPMADDMGASFGPEVRKSTAVEPDFTTRREELINMMRNPDMPNMARGAMGVLGDEDRVGIDPRTGRMVFGAGIPR